MSSMNQSKNGHFHKNTVEITFNGTKVRVSKEVADSIANGKKVKKVKKGKDTEEVEAPVVEAAEVEAVEVEVPKKK